MIKSSFCDYTLFKEAIIIVGRGAEAVARQADDCISKINNTQVVNAKDLDVVISKYNLIEYIVLINRKHLEVYGNITEMSWLMQIVNSESFKSKIKIRGKNCNIKDVEIAVPLKYFSNFWRTLEMQLIDCKLIPF